MIEIKKYEAEYKEVWNQFLLQSRIDTFLFNRDFMDYHSDRFQDYSFMIYKKGKLEALLPGNINGDTFYSHQGLTYGGLVTSCNMKTSDVLEVFNIINQCLRTNKIRYVVYKPTPIMYHNIPSQEDIYAMFRLGAQKIGCNISSTILREHKIPFIELRKRGIRRASKANVKIIESNDLSAFWTILELNLLSTHRVKPVHSLEEITMLKEKFTQQIRMFNALIDGNVVGGCLLFVMKNVVHVQYISANELGKSIGALDLLFDELINNKFSEYPVFDFGQSTEKMGAYLNENLIFQKEGFGGRGVVYDIYKYTIDED